MFLCSLRRTLRFWPSNTIDVIPHVFVLTWQFKMLNFHITSFEFVRSIVKPSWYLKKIYHMNSFTWNYNVPTLENHFFRNNFHVIMWHWHYFVQVSLDDVKLSCTLYIWVRVSVWVRLTLSFEFFLRCHHLANLNQAKKCKQVQCLVCMIPLTLTRNFVWCNVRFVCMLTLRKTLSRDLIVVRINQTLLTSFLMCFF